MTDIAKLSTPQHPFPTLGWAGSKEPDDVTGRYLLCTTCGGLKADDCGLLHSAHDACFCKRPPRNETSQQREERLPCILCRACGLAIVSGHTRWRRLVCPPCRHRLHTFNGQAGAMVLPAGIHSLVNRGPVLEMARRPTKQQFKNFADAMNAMFKGVRDFESWGDRLVLDRLRQFGFAKKQLIPVEEYLDACRAAGIDESTGWRLLEQAWFDDV